MVRITAFSRHMRTFFATHSLKDGDSLQSSHLNLRLPIPSTLHAPFNHLIVIYSPFRPRSSKPPAIPFRSTYAAS